MCNTIKNQIIKQAIIMLYKDSGVNVNVRLLPSVYFNRFSIELPAGVTVRRGLSAGRAIEETLGQGTRLLVSDDGLVVEMPSNEKGAPTIKDLSIQPTKMGTPLILGAKADGSTCACDLEQGSLLIVGSNDNRDNFLRASLDAFRSMKPGVTEVRVSSVKELEVVAAEVEDRKVSMNEMKSSLLIIIDDLNSLMAEISEDKKEQAELIRKVLRICLGRAVDVYTVIGQSTPISGFQSLININCPFRLIFQLPSADTEAFLASGADCLKKENDALYYEGFFSAERVTPITR